MNNFGNLNYLKNVIYFKTNCRDDIIILSQDLFRLQTKVYINLMYIKMYAMSLAHENVAIKLKDIQRFVETTYLLLYLYNFNWNRPLVLGRPEYLVCEPVYREPTFGTNPSLGPNRNRTLLKSFNKERCRPQTGFFR